MRRTKILATVGPATSTPAQLTALITAGADALRLNLSHGTDEEHRESLTRIHHASKLAGREVAVVADVPGPKVRIRAISNGELRLSTGQRWSLDSDLPRLNREYALRIGSTPLPNPEPQAEPSTPSTPGARGSFFLHAPPIGIPATRGSRERHSTGLPRWSKRAGIPRDRLEVWD